MVISRKTYKNILEKLRAVKADQGVVPLISLETIADEICDEIENDINSVKTFAKEEVTYVQTEKNVEDNNTPTQKKKGTYANGYFNKKGEFVPRPMPVSSCTGYPDA